MNKTRRWYTRNATNLRKDIVSRLRCPRMIVLIEILCRHELRKCPNRINKTHGTTELQAPTSSVVSFQEWISKCDLCKRTNAFDLELRQGLGCSNLTTVKRSRRIKEKSRQIQTCYHGHESLVRRYHHWIHSRHHRHHVVTLIPQFVVLSIVII